MSVENSEGEHFAFGRWLLTQSKREGLIGQLATNAIADLSFPRDGDPEAVRKRLRENYADGDMFEAVDDAEIDWLAY